MEAQFVISAARPEQFPAETLPEIAFLGRSNVGKSSLLNCLTGQKDLAFTSARPGCTQLVNFYRIDGQFHFVDLPGYGYARVPKDIVFQWKQLIEQYLLQRDSLQLCFLILDARRGWMDKDLELKQWLEFHNRRYLVIATKIGQIEKSKRSAAKHSGHPEPVSGGRASAVLGRKLPRSEGNLASDQDNQDPAAIAAPTPEESDTKTDGKALARGDSKAMDKGDGKAADPKSAEPQTSADKTDAQGAGCERQGNASRSAHWA